MTSRCLDVMYGVSRKNISIQSPNKFVKLVVMILSQSQMKTHTFQTNAEVHRSRCSG